MAASMAASMAAPDSELVIYQAISTAALRLMPFAAALVAT
jgi:hypothetical protein